MFINALDCQTVTCSEEKGCSEICPKSDENLRKTRKIMDALCVGQNPEEMMLTGKIAQKIRERLSEKSMRACLLCSELEKYRNFNESLQNEAPDFFGILQQERAIFEELIAEIEKRLHKGDSVDAGEMLGYLNGALDLEEVTLMLPGESEEIRAIFKEICKDIEDVYPSKNAIAALQKTA